jgi:hypothetical protein
VASRRIYQVLKGMFPNSPGSSSEGEVRSHAPSAPNITKGTRNFTDATNHSQKRARAAA